MAAFFRLFSPSKSASKSTGGVRGGFRGGDEKDDGTSERLFVIVKDLKRPNTIARKIKKMEPSAIMTTFDRFKAFQIENEEEKKSEDDGTTMTMTQQRTGAEIAILAEMVHDRDITNQWGYAQAKKEGMYVILTPQLFDRSLISFVDCSRTKRRLSIWDSPSDDRVSQWLKRSQNTLSMHDQITQQREFERVNYEWVVSMVEKTLNDIRGFHDGIKRRFFEDCTNISEDLCWSFFDAHNAPKLSTNAPSLLRSKLSAYRSGDIAVVYQGKKMLPYLVNGVNSEILWLIPFESIRPGFDETKDHVRCEIEESDILIDLQNDPICDEGMTKQWTDKNVCRIDCKLQSGAKLSWMTTKRNLGLDLTNQRNRIDIWEYLAVLRRSLDGEELRLKEQRQLTQKYVESRYVLSYRNSGTSMARLPTARMSPLSISPKTKKFEQESGATEAVEYEMPDYPLSATLLSLLGVSINLRKKATFVSRVLEFYKDDFDSESMDIHWTDLVQLSEKYCDESQRLHLFKQCLKVLGMAPNKRGFTALDYAIKIGNSEFIRATLAYERGLRSQNSLEEHRAEKFVRWNEVSRHFVDEFVLRQYGEDGEHCLKLLQNSLIEFIQQRGDFGAVDLMGIVWHSSDEAKRTVLEKLMQGLQTTLDFDTVHHDKVGWHWARDSVLKHPIWLSTDIEQKMPESPVLAGEASAMKSMENTRQRLTKVTLDSNILFERVNDMVESEVASKCGDQLEQAFKAMVASEPKEWEKICEFEPKKFELKLRQDEIEKGVKPILSSAGINNISMMSNSLEFNASKIVDTKAYMTRLLIQAHLVNPSFMKLINEAFSALGDVKFGPVKKSDRMEPKSEEYASRSDPHCHWPFTACILDVIRASVTVKTLSEFLNALIVFDEFCSQTDQITIVRFKSGFTRYIGTSIYPSQYTDIKMNVAVWNESRDLAVIGEVQFLLDSVLRAKLNAHELYEVTRSLPLYIGAAKRVKSEWSFEQQLLLTGGNQKYLSGPLCSYPWMFQLESLDFALLFKNDFDSIPFINDLATAIVEQSNQDRPCEIIHALNDSIDRISNTRRYGKGTGRLINAIFARIYKQEIEDDTGMFITEDPQSLLDDSSKEDEMMMITIEKKRRDECFEMMTELYCKIAAKTTPISNISDLLLTMPDSVKSSIPFSSKWFPRFWSTDSFTSICRFRRLFDGMNEDTMREVREQWMSVVRVALAKKPSELEEWKSFVSADKREMKSVLKDFLDLLTKESVNKAQSIHTVDPWYLAVLPECMSDELWDAFLSHAEFAQNVWKYQSSVKGQSLKEFSQWFNEQSEHVKKTWMEWNSQYSRSLFARLLNEYHCYEDSMMISSLSDDSKVDESMVISTAELFDPFVPVFQSLQLSRTFWNNIIVNIKSPFSLVYSLIPTELMNAESFRRIVVRSMIDERCTMDRYVEVFGNHRVANRDKGESSSTSLATLAHLAQIIERIPEEQRQWDKLVKQVASVLPSQVSASESRFITQCGKEMFREITKRKPKLFRLV